MEETLLSVGIDTGAASPQTGQPVWGPHVMFALRRFYGHAPAPQSGGPVVEVPK